jgi:hypothetical protein
MRWPVVVVLTGALISCDGLPVIDTQEKCKAAGGRVVPAPGPPASCEDGEENIGNIPFGIEGAICCRAKSPGSVR